MCPFVPPIVPGSPESWLPVVCCSLTGGNFDAAAMSMSRYLPVESAMPGTTLGLIALKAFETGGTLYGGWGGILFA